MAFAGVGAGKKAPASPSHALGLQCSLGVDPRGLSLAVDGKTIVLRRAGLAWSAQQVPGDSPQHTVTALLIMLPVRSTASPLEIARGDSLWVRAGTSVGIWQSAARSLESPPDG